MRVAVIEAGILGSSVAYHLSRNGAETALIDSGTSDQATTTATFAWLNANRKEPREYFELNVAGMEEHKRLFERLPKPFTVRGRTLRVGQGRLTPTRRPNVVLYYAQE